MQTDPTSAAESAESSAEQGAEQGPRCRDSRKWERTQTPGIFKRQNKDGSFRYAVIYRAAGRQRKELASTLAEARRLKAARTTDVARGEFQEQHRIMFRDYLREWIDRYRGRGNRGFRENTREEYRRLLDNYAHAYFSENLRLVDVRTLDLSRFIGWLCDERAQGKVLADKTVANILIPLRAALATAKQEGVLRNNPADGLALPSREEIREDEDEDVRTLSREQLGVLLSIAPDKHKVFFTLLALTGSRISEGIGLQRRDFHLDGSDPHVRIRRAIVKRREEAPKTRYGRREIALSADLVSQLRIHLGEIVDAAPDAVAFPNRNGAPLDPDNLRNRTLKPLMEEVGAPWAAFHALRHTYASIQLAQGVSIVQLSRAMGHHSAAFTLARYVHLLPGESAPALDLDHVLAVAEAPDASVDLSADVGQLWGNESHRLEAQSPEGEVRQIALESELPAPSELSRTSAEGS